MKLKRTLTSIVALLLACIVPLSAAATELTKDYEAADGTQLAEAFNNADNDAAEVTAVNITLTADIETEIADLVSKAGKTYTIIGKTEGSETEYKITKTVTVKGDGDVTIKADINTGDNNALSVEGGADVTVEGDITGKNGVIAQFDDAGYAPTVTVNGDIVGQDRGVAARGAANVTVDGDVTATEKQGSGVYTAGSAQVEVTGKVEALDAYYGWTYGVNAIDYSKVTVGNGVSGGDIAIKASGNAEVIVKSGGVTGRDAEAEFSENEAGEGIIAQENAVVKVTGDVKGGFADRKNERGEGGNAIEARDNSYVEVNGSAIGGSGNAYGGHGVRMESTATVKISGDAVGGDAKKTEDTDPAIAGDGVRIEQVEDTSYTSELTVLGSITGGKATGTKRYDGYGVCYVLQSTDGIEPEAESDKNKADLKGIIAFYAVNDKRVKSWQDAVTDETYSTYPKGALNNQSYAAYLAFNYMANWYDEIRDTSGVISAGDVTDFKAELEAELAEFAGTESFDLTGLTNENCDWAKLNNADPAELKELIADMAEIYNKYYQKAVDNADAAELKALPTVTTWKIASGGDTGMPVAATIRDFGLLDEEVITRLNSLHNYIVRINDSSNGTATSDVERANPGGKVEITATPSAGYKVGSVKLGSDALTQSDGTYNFEMGTYGGAVVSATFTDGSETQKTTTSSGPATDDGSALALWCIICTASAAAFVTLALNKKRRAN